MRRRRLLLIDDRLPTAVGAGHGRMLGAVRELVAAGWDVSVWARRPTADDQEPLRALGVERVEGDLDPHLRTPHVLYDVVLVSRPTQLATELTMVRALQPQAAVVYDCEALWHRLYARRAELAADAAERDRLRAYARRYRAVEELAGCFADLIVCVSEVEREVLRGFPGAAAVTVVPIRARGIVPTAEPFGARHGAVLVAGWIAGGDSPNADALRWLASDVLPLVREREPSFTLRVTGADPPASVRDLPGVSFVGHVPDLRVVYGETRVALSPVRFGGGVNVKAVEALQHGVPVVATTVGGEGTGLETLPPLEPTDDPRRLADRLVELTGDEPAWREARDGVLGLLARWEEEGAPSWADVIDTARPGSAERDALELDLLARDETIAGLRARIRSGAPIFYPTLDTPDPLQATRYRVVDAVNDAVRRVAPLHRALRWAARRRVWRA